MISLTRSADPMAGWVREYKTRKGNTAHRSCSDYEPPGHPYGRSYFVKIQEGIMPISNISATSRRTQILSNIQNQCRQMAFDLAFSIPKLKETGQPSAAARLQSASIIISAVADDLESVLNGGRRYD